MADDSQRSEIAKKVIVMQVPGMETATRRTIVYRTADSAPLTLDVYRAADMTPGERRPAVVFVLGFPHPAFADGLKEMGSYVSWARLLAASGMVAVTYSYRDPVADLAAVLERLRHDAAELGIDEQRLGLWSASGNVPMALAALIASPAAFRCAVLCYGFMLDLDGAQAVAQAAAQFGFVHPAAGKTVDDLPAAVPLFVARAGQDAPPLNQTLDRFVARALARNLPLTVVNHATGPHAFDILDDSDTTRAVLRAIVAFLRLHLGLGA